MNKFLIIFIAFIYSFGLKAQIDVRQKLNGKIIADSKELDGIYIINLKNEQSTISKDGGYFSIEAKIGDTIMFSAIQFKGKLVPITAKCFTKELFFVHLETMLRKLDEVLIRQYKNINAISLGIIPKDTKIYTPAERRLKTATGLDFSKSINGMMGGSFSTDPLLSWFSGKGNQLLKELDVEHKETWLQILDELFSDKIFVDKLKINFENIKGFKYFLVENNTFVNLLKEKNKPMARFMMGELAIEYNAIITNEKQ